MTEPRFCRLDRGRAWGVKPSRRSASSRSQCSRAHRACSSTARTGSEDSRRSRVQGGGPRTSAGSNALRTAAGSSELDIGDGAPVQRRNEPVPERLDRCPREGLVESQSDLPEVAARLAVNLHDLPPSARRCPCENARRSQDRTVDGAGSASGRSSGRTLRKSASGRTSDIRSPRTCCQFYHGTPRRINLNIV